MVIFICLLQRGCKKNKIVSLRETTNDNNLLCKNLILNILISLPQIDFIRLNKSLK